MESTQGPSLLYITNIESPICRECEEVLSTQTAEIARLAAEHPDVEIFSINIRKNPYSENGSSLALSWWGVNVTWPWVEDFQPYPAAGRYMDYWSSGTGFSNPTIIVLNSDGDVVKVYRVYQIGRGLIDGIQSSDKLYADLRSADERSSGWLSSSRAGTSAIGMFALGMMTSLSPCSVALLAALFSYIISRRRRDTADGYREGLAIGIAFTIGMAAVFFVIGLFVSQLGIFMRSSRLFDLAAGLLLVVLGVNSIIPLSEFVGPIFSFRRSEKSYLERLINVSLKIFERSSTLGAFFLGAFFSLGWAPCAISLVFPVIIWLISQDISPLGGGIMLFVFGLGHGVPVIPMAALSRSAAARIADRYISAGSYITKIFGILVITLGVLFAARYFGYALW
ncbi:MULTISPECIES: cytochrome c biogenesis CcdA family protein [Methanothrix]|uniref:cytochrome c biogenesis CcdA family protein n=1 Tax=Methanothrix TaxID=2222 RepID=UPI001E513600|nr:MULTISPECIES: cytochrome c biogenesis CcdA family protein [Methanothrix]